MKLPGFLLVLLLPFVFCLQARGQQQSERIFIPDHLILHTLSGEQISINQILKDDKFDLFIFLSPECPLCQNYTLTLNNLYIRFQGNPIAWVGIIPGKGFSRQQMIDFVGRFHIRFPVYVDSDMQLTHLLGATITPQVILLNRKGEQLYSGAIDNWAVSLGQQRTIITAHYLQDALSSCLRGLPLTITHTQPVGCYINDF
ncbi:redoxin family protein [Thermoflavifilum thermophilum]|uniref:AhpC/TSA family protein n=1 Tax=Thermoflavifilum thermophilum TaxID=1393122 RepID=A0A1I7N1F7_9BACT|nr:redoxin family protein [Thermoflavifilum thermophilum]SFV28502.1 AhpC/TSA family protein [Thermoflavifilum thermophilum]